MNEVEKLIKSLIKTKSTKEIKSILSKSYDLSESQASSIIKKVRKQMGLFKSVFHERTDDEDETVVEKPHNRRNSKYNED